MTFLLLFYCHVTIKQLLRLLSNTSAFFFQLGDTALQSFHIADAVHSRGRKRDDCLASAVRSQQKGTHNKVASQLRLRLAYTELAELLFKYSILMTMSIIDFHITGFVLFVLTQKVCQVPYNVVIEIGKLGFSYCILAVNLLVLKVIKGY